MEPMVMLTRSLDLVY